MRAFGKVAELERTDRDSHKSKHFDAEGIEHATNLAVLAFVEDDFDPGMFLASAEEVCALRFEDVALWNFNAALKGFEETGVGHDADLDMVGLVKMKGRIGNARGPFGVVGKEKKAFTDLVEAADRSDPAQIRWQERIDGVAAFFIGGGGNDAAGLIQDEINLLRRSQRFSLY